MDDGEDYETLAYKQRLKAALHYSVGQICEQLEEVSDVRINRQVIAALTELMFKECETLGQNLELFAKHAKRKTIEPDDVKLFFQKSRSVVGYLTKIQEEAAARKEEAGKESKKRKESAPKSSRGAVATHLETD